MHPALHLGSPNKLGCNGFLNSLLPHMLSQSLDLGIIGSIFGCLLEAETSPSTINYSKSPTIKITIYYQNHQSMFTNFKKKTSPPTSFPVQTQTPTKESWVRFLLTKTVCSFQAVIGWKGNTSGCNTCHPSHLDVLEQDDLRCQWRRSWEAIWKVIHIFNASLCSSYQILYGKPQGFDLQTDSTYGRTVLRLVPYWFYHWRSTVSCCLHRFQRRFKLVFCNL